ncbi:MAG TPA: hypothetical protein VG889_21245 [Rhizomicrobium sp.]|nr:hypothetical protein [Rhizomicrobium sp.]
MEALGDSAALYPFALDPARDAMLLVPMAKTDYRAASFLDERLGKRGAWTPLPRVAEALSGARDVRPLHFIFHAGHVGSTLLSRLLDETGAVLSLREPLPLRQLADGHDQGLDLDATFETMLRLWERGFESTQAVVLKATSAAVRIAPKLLAMRPNARAVMLNVSAETYLATMLAGENSAKDLNAHGPERLHRLSARLGAPAPRPTNLGQLAAMSWLAEALTQAELARAFGARVLAVDFDSLLVALPETLRTVLDHFALPEAEIAGDALARYSKAPEHAYGPELRARRLDEARRLYPREISAAIGWLQTLGAQYRSVAALL